MMLARLFGSIKNLEYSDILSNKEKQKRLSICNLCEYFRKDFIYLFFFKKKGVTQCSICKCSINDKVLFEKEKCPKLKW